MLQDVPYPWHGVSLSLHVLMSSAVHDMGLVNPRGIKQQRVLAAREGDPEESVWHPLRTVVIGMLHRYGQHMAQPIFPLQAEEGICCKCYVIFEKLRLTYNV